MEQAAGSRRAVTALEAWLVFLSVVLLGAGGIVTYYGVYAWLGSDKSHGTRVGVSAAAGVIGGLALVTPYLVVLAVLGLLREIADKR